MRRRQALTRYSEEQCGDMAKLAVEDNPQLNYRVKEWVNTRGQKIRESADVGFNAWFKLLMIALSNQFFDSKIAVFIEVEFQPLGHVFRRLLFLVTQHLPKRRVVIERACFRNVILSRRPSSLH